MKSKRHMKIKVKAQRLFSNLFRLIAYAGLVFVIHLNPCYSLWLQAQLCFF